MAKKKTTTSGQRLNRELLERARQQARAIEAEEAEEAAADETEVEIDVEASLAEAAESVRREPVRATAAGAARRSSTAKRLREKNQESRRKTMTGDEISEILANPTKFVSEAELREQYGFVLKDLRSMALLAGASFFFLVVLAVLLPT